MSIARRSNLLILRGVDPNKLNAFNFDVNKIFEPTIIEPTENYDSIPATFTSAENWPKSTNLKCWSCARNFSTYPKFVPQNPRKDAKNNDVCDVLGNFDEWGCVIDFIETEMPPDQRWDLKESVVLFESKFSGSKKKKIKIMATPKRYLMKAYCGNHGLTEKQYQEKINQNNTEYDLSSYRMCDMKER